MPSGHFNNIRNDGGPNGDQRRLEYDVPACRVVLGRTDHLGPHRKRSALPVGTTQRRPKNRLSFNPPNPLGYCAAPGKGPVASALSSCCGDQLPDEEAELQLRGRRCSPVTLPRATEPFDLSGF